MVPLFINIMSVSIPAWNMQWFPSSRNCGNSDRVKQLNTGKISLQIMPSLRICLHYKIYFHLVDNICLHWSFLVLLIKLQNLKPFKNELFSVLYTYNNHLQYKGFTYGLSVKDMHLFCITMKLHFISSSLLTIEMPWKLKEPASPCSFLGSSSILYLGWEGSYTCFPTSNH